MEYIYKKKGGKYHIVNDSKKKEKKDIEELVLFQKSAVDGGIDYCLTRR